MSKFVRGIIYCPSSSVRARPSFPDDSLKCIGRWILWSRRFFFIEAAVAMHSAAEEEAALHIEEAIRRSPLIEKNDQKASTNHPKTIQTKPFKKTIKQKPSNKNIKNTVLRPSKNIKKPSKRHKRKNQTIENRLKTVLGPSGGPLIQPLGGRIRGPGGERGGPGAPLFC